MALPTAPLGQLPTMSMPYNIGTYEKPPSIWEKALASFLVNAAGSVAQKGAENVMTRDNASEFGGKDASGFGRLLGPNVSDKEAEQKRAQIFAGGESDKSRAAATALEDQRLQGGLDEQLLRDKNAQIRQDTSTQAGLDESYLRDMNANLRLGQEQSGNSALARLRADLEAKDPLRTAEVGRAGAETKKVNAEADREQFITDMLRNQGKGGKAGAGAVDPSIAQFAAGLSPRQQALQTFLASPQGMQKYPTADAVMSSPTPHAVNPVGLPSTPPFVDPSYTGPDATAFGKHSPIIDALNAFLNPTTVDQLHQQQQLRALMGPIQ